MACIEFRTPAGGGGHEHMDYSPNGVFSPTNSSVKCPKSGYGYTFDDAPPKMVKP